MGSFPSSLTGLAANPLRDAPRFIDEFDSLSPELITDSISLGVILCGFCDDSGIDRDLNFSLIWSVISNASGVGVRFASKAEDRSEIAQQLPAQG
jgi:hypothetical protein